MVAGERRWPAASNSMDFMNPPLDGLMVAAIRTEPPRRHCASERCGRLRWMAADGSRATTVTDPDGHEVVLLARIWEEKIARDHPELVDHLDAVTDTVAKPDHVEPDALPARTRFYRRNVGPSRWLMAVVSYEQQPARIITALANRKDPKRWKP
jgi:hypothetical protein